MKTRPVQFVVGGVAFPAERIEPDLHDESSGMEELHERGELLRLRAWAGFWPMLCAFATVFGLLVVVVVLLVLG